ncbi:MAG TPA: hypothetical protein VMB03_33895 [Bryobacteraceae bacterium]|nr:hypothetical protein [Bryobacteraceae bacterium]
MDRQKNCRDSGQPQDRVRNARREHCQQKDGCSTQRHSGPRRKELPGIDGARGTPLPKDIGDDAGPYQQKGQRGRAASAVNFKTRIPPAAAGGNRMAGVIC